MVCCNRKYWFVVTGHNGLFVTTIHYALLQHTIMPCYNNPLYSVTTIHYVLLQQSIMSCYNKPVFPVATNHYVLLQHTIMSCYNTPLCPVTTIHYVLLQQSIIIVVCCKGHNGLLQQEILVCCNRT
jgi:hypothetical protein